MEKLEDLQLNGLKIYQRTDLYHFTSDAVLLSDFVSLKKSDMVVDFGTGSGILPLLMYGKYPVMKIVGVEIQKELAEMAQKSVDYNDLNDKITIVKGRIQTFYKTIEKHPDVIVCNPPYRKAGGGVMPKNDSDRIARFEVEITLSEIIESARRCLKFGGRFYMIHSADRLSEIMIECERNDIAIRRIRFVQTKKNSLAHLVMIEGRSGGNSQLKILPPLVLKNDDNTDSEEVIRIYSRGNTEGKEKIDGEKA